MPTQSTIFTLTTPSATIPSQASESSDEPTCRPCAAITPASHPASKSDEFSESENLWITEYTITYQGRPAFTVSIMEFRNGKVVHETQYFADPFEAPAWRSQWVQKMP